MLVPWWNRQAFCEDKLTSKEIKGGVLGLPALARFCLAVKLALVVVESPLFIPAMTLVIPVMIVRFAVLAPVGIGVKEFKH